MLQNISFWLLLYHNSLIQSVFNVFKKKLQNFNALFFSSNYSYAIIAHWFKEYLGDIS